MIVTKRIANYLEEVLNNRLGQQEIEKLLQQPKHANLGDISFPCFELAKLEKANPKQISQQLAEKIDYPMITKVEAVGPYLNLFLDKKIISEMVVNNVLSKGNQYGKMEDGYGKVVTIDLSSPNIAKPFSMGHLRSTVIGNSIGLLLEKIGYKVIRINHLGDWGTQFGKLIAAYKLWGGEQAVRENPIGELFKLYIKFHEQAEIDASLNDLGRSWFQQLEAGNEEALELWKWFREESLKEFNKIYEKLGVKFDSNAGEAFFNDKMQSVIEDLKEKNLLLESDGAQIVELEDMPPCLIQKSDGTTLYATRDLATAIYRKETYDFDKSLYVVGNEQRLHFEQFKQVLSKMNYSWASDLVHIPFGMMLKDGKKMSTRKGKVVFLDEVLQQAVDYALENIEEKNPNLANKQKVAEQIGVGAVIFHDLKNDRLNDVEFSYQEMLKFEGSTGPYLQYTYARACSILRKANQTFDQNLLKFEESEWESTWPIVQKLDQFKSIIGQAAMSYDPSKLAKYLLKLAQLFNAYYAQIRILEDNPYQASRLALTKSVTIVIKEGLRLLGMKAPEEM